MATKKVKTEAKPEVKAAAPEVTAPAAAAEKAEPKSRGPKGVADSAIVTLLVTANPKREGSKAHARFAGYVSGGTVADQLDAGVTTPDLVYDAKHGFISIDGYDPGEIIVAKPKAPAKPKAEAKGKKEKVVKSAEQTAKEAEANAEAAEETMA